jgi:hypothetical protein
MKTDILILFGERAGTRTQDPLIKSLTAHIFWKSPEFFD